MERIWYFSVPWYYTKVKKYKKTFSLLVVTKSFPNLFIKWHKNWETLEQESEDLHTVIPKTLETYFVFSFVHVGICAS